MTEVLSQWFKQEPPTPPKIDPIEGNLIRYNQEKLKTNVRVDFSKLPPGIQSAMILTIVVAQTALYTKFALSERSETAKQSSTKWAEKSFGMGMEGATTSKWWTEKTGMASSALTFLGPTALDQLGGPLSSKILSSPLPYANLFPNFTDGQTLSDWKKRLQGASNMVQQYGQVESQVAGAEAQTKTTFGNSRVQVFHDGTQQASQAKGEVGQAEQQAREVASKITDGIDQANQRIISSMA